MTITRALPMVYVLVLYVLVYRWLLCCQNKMNICLYKNQKSGQANVLNSPQNDIPQISWAHSSIAKPQIA